MIAAKQVEYLTAIDKALLRSILYFDIFNYPITAVEAKSFAPVVIEKNCEEILDNLVMEGILFKHDNFYSAQDDSEIATKRLNGNRLAEQRMKTARKYSRRISSFPFVRAVMLSGSISKNFMDEKSDIDYFIITEPKRLWIVRTSLVIIRRILFFNSLKNFCVNYFIDTENLTIPDRNIFAATELGTLKSMCGESTIRKFRNENEWIYSELPQIMLDDVKVSDDSFRLKKLVEKVANLFPMERLNIWLMNLAKARWKRKYSDKWTGSDFEIAFRTTEGVSKCHPRFFQKRALDQLQGRIREFEFKHGIDLTI